MITRRKALLLGGGAGITAGLGLRLQSALAQGYPSKPIKIIVPFAAGGVTDFVGRLVADYVAIKTSQPVVVENRAGSGGLIGMEAVARAAPDGYTYGSANTGDVISGYLHSRMAFDPLKDLVPVGMIGEAPQLLVVSSHVPVRTFQEFLAYARANPGKINYGSAGTGSLTHVGAELLAKLADLKIVHVPYRGAIPAITDLIAGNIHMMHISLNPTYVHIKSGSLRALVVTAKERWVEWLPDVPTSTEAGLPDYLMDIWFGLVAPRGTPRPVRDQINGYLRDMVADVEARKRIIAGFMRPTSKTVDEFTALLEEEAPRWEKIVRKTGVTID
jgi:tripartite-type tricarboxylate transporter receptor subunit TctC